MIHKLVFARWPSIIILNLVKLQHYFIKKPHPIKHKLGNSNVKNLNTHTISSKNWHWTSIRTKPVQTPNAANTPPSLIANTHQQPQQSPRTTLTIVLPIENGRRESPAGVYFSWDRRLRRRRRPLRPRSFYHSFSTFRDFTRVGLTSVEVSLKVYRDLVGCWFSGMCLLWVCV